MFKSSSYRFLYTWSILIVFSNLCRKTMLCMFWKIKVLIAFRFLTGFFGPLWSSYKMSLTGKRLKKWLRVNLWWIFFSFCNIQWCHNCALIYSWSSLHVIFFFEIKVWFAKMLLEILAICKHVKIIQRIADLLQLQMFAWKFETKMNESPFNYWLFS